MFNPCVIIPVYNHYQHIHTVVDELASISRYVLPEPSTPSTANSGKQCGPKFPCLIIDDGSSSPCREILHDIACNRSWIELIRLEHNQGKGVAVTTGLKHAHQRGFSHALQIDADGQHDVNDIPRFLNRARSHPHAVVTGVRRYGEMPPKRRYGRMVTDAWVWINTLSPAIKDSMCGYRLYPLPETMALLSSTTVGRRMDFDTDILVRLYWHGIAIEQLETRVRYHNSISHFDILKDNLRISRMHAKLFLGMLSRLPMLMARNWNRSYNHVQHRN